MSTTSKPLGLPEQLNRASVEYRNQDQEKGYRIGTYEYPEDLRNRPDLQHYVAFYVNVRDKSTRGKNKNPKEYFTEKDKETGRINALRDNGAPLSIENLRSGLADALTLLEGVTVATAAFKTFKGLNSRLANKRDALIGAGVAGLATFGAIEAAKAIIKPNDLPAFSPGNTSRLKDVITLHVSEKPVVKYQTNYIDRELGSLAGLLVQGSAKETVAAGSAVRSDEYNAALLATLAKVPTLKSKGGLISDLLELTTRTKTNPFREVLFESVDYRSFNFSYRFFPKNERETNRVKNIIELFKINMLPEITSEKLFYIYPSEFDIEYFYKDSPNPYLHKFARCALVNMEVDYGGDQFVTFQDGSPVEIGLTLTFRELEQLTSEKAANGY
jgi:hypothetical protein